MRRGDLQSRTIDVLRFLLIIYVVFIHAYTSTRGMFDADLYPVYKYLSFLISLEIAQIAVPSFFFISGYLFYFHLTTYRSRLKKGVHTLLTPYLLWNGLILAMYFLVEKLPGTGAFFSGNNLPIGQFTWQDLIRAFWDSGDWNGGNGTPIVHQFWYIRNLILLEVLSPLVALFVRYAKGWGVGALLLWWLFTPGQAFMAESVAFFCAGAWYSLRGRDFLPDFRKAFPVVLFLYPLFIIVNMVLRGGGGYIQFLDRIGFFVGLVFTVGLVAYWIERKGLRDRSFAGLRGLGFFIFAFHDPMLTFVKRLAIRLCGPITDAVLVASYFLAPLTVIGICILVYRLLKWNMPRVLGILIGR